MLSTILLLIAFFVLVAAAFNVPASPRVNLFALGMAIWAASRLLAGL